MNNWDQFQSTPKLLPPSVFERTTSTTSDNNSGVNSTMNENESLLSNRGGDSQFSQLSKEFEKLKDELRKLYGENESLRNKNKGIFFLIYLIFY